MKSLFRRWLEKLLGLRVEVEDEIERTVRINTAVAGAMSLVEALKEGEEHAAELGKTHPQLAAALRARIAALAGVPPTAHVPDAADVPPPAPLPPAGPPKRLPGRPKKSVAELSAPTPTTPNGVN